MIAGAADMMCEQFNPSLLQLAAVSPESTSVSISENLVVSLLKSTTVVGSTTRKSSPTSIKSGSHTDIGTRRLNEDQHIIIDDLSKHLGDAYKWGLPSSFYAIFDGHGGSEAATYIKEHAMRLFFEDSDLPQAAPAGASDSDDVVDNDFFLKQVEESHHKAFLQADQALADECSVSGYCGTTALTVLIMGRRIIIANAGDCRAVLRRNGSAMQITQDHRGSTCLHEKERCERLGGYFDEDGYLNGQLGVTRALGDWHMKKDKFLIAEPDVRQMVLTDNDEFMIIACDGIWDVLSNQEAVAFVRCQLRQHNDAQRCAKELINQALRLHSTDNLTVIVVCFSSHTYTPAAQPRFPNSRLFRKKPLNIFQGDVKFDQVVT
ncbi:hypothetical protein L1987_00333 [Smallanthus sonchifolius]|uniref:Uncharacterized protein n=1 Tax=Smallanthus sonchifolius TaxID=185202 RepID=A0ACB9K217_9ASTR|nr:hypothetical protein L1987_00333 [Smallanthus sonchifolius]